jgi:ABC-type transport system involved in cytochrome c biogenesis ATPase subunit
MIAMIFQEITPQGLGPFSVPATLKLEHDVTILTGPNDVGKSYLLRLFQLLCGTVGVEEDDVNSERVYDAERAWTKDSDISCNVVVIANHLASEYFGPRDNTASLPAIGDKITANCLLAPEFKNRKQVVEFLHNKAPSNQYPHILKMPNTLFYPSDIEIGTTIELENPNVLERSLLLHAFGPNWLAKLRSRDFVNRRTDIKAAEHRLNENLSRILPTSLPLRLGLDLDPEVQRLSLYLEDSHNIYTPLHYRGAGAQRIVNILMGLLNAGNSQEQTIILLDEPENGLHADAQHQLRTFLEDLAQSEKIQVICATHSPSMINPMRPECIRLLRRDRDEKSNKVMTVIDNRPVNHNMEQIRMSLGLWPIDSLLYAPITVIVEGLTEIICVPFLLQRFYREKFKGFEVVDKYLPLVHFLNGEGDSYEYMCRLAKSQKCRPIIFVDGDKARQVKQQKVEERHPDVPVLILEQAEFEEVVPKGIYFQALSEVTGQTNLSEEAFTEWEDQQDEKTLPERMVFTKRVEHWLADQFPDTCYDKPDVMHKALETVDIAKVEQVKFRELMEKIEIALTSLIQGV